MNTAFSRRNSFMTVFKWLFTWFKAFSLEIVIIIEVNALLIYDSQFPNLSDTNPFFYLTIRNSITFSKCIKMKFDN